MKYIVSIAGREMDVDVDGVRVTVAGETAVRRDGTPSALSLINPSRG